MNERVRITGPARHPAASRTPSRLGDVTEQTPLGDVYLRSLLAEQLRLAVRIIALVAITLGLVPLAFHLAPGLAERKVVGLPLSWVLLGVVVYPFLLLLAWRYVRRAERNERVFADLVHHRQQD